MSNALGNLFGDIADAIREKNGETATMKPTAFAEAIRAIEVGGGSGEGGGTNMIITGGERTVTASETTSVTFTHNLGVMPDIIVVITFGHTGDYDIRCGLILSQHFKDLCPDLEYGTIISKYNSSGVFAGGYDTTGGTNSIVYGMFGAPTNVTENSFTMGATNATFLTDTYYYFVAGRVSQ